MSKSVTQGTNQLVTNQTTTGGQPGSITMTPKFFFGHKGDVRGNLFFLDNNTVCYPCGHNVVFYSMDEKN